MQQRVLLMRCLDEFVQLSTVWDTYPHQLSDLNLSEQGFVQLRKKIASRFWCYQWEAKLKEQATERMTEKLSNESREHHSRSLLGTYSKIK